MDDEFTGVRGQTVERDLFGSGSYDWLPYVLGCGNGTGFLGDSCDEVCMHPIGSGIGFGDGSGVGYGSGSGVGW